MKALGVFYSTGLLAAIGWAGWLYSTLWNASDPSWFDSFAFGVILTCPLVFLGAGVIGMLIYGILMWIRSGDIFFGMWNR